MGWYRTGTVSVAANSATITGVGTAFLDNVKIGDEFAGPDGRSYEITNIATNTSLTVIPAYKGATATGQAYHIKPTQSWAREAALQLANYTGRIGGAIQKADGAVQKTSIGSKYLADADQILPGFAYGLGGRPDAFPQASADDATAPPGVYYIIKSEHTGFPADFGILVRSGGRVRDDAWLLDKFYAVATTDVYERKNINGGGWDSWNPVLHRSDAAIHLGLKSGAFADLVGDVGTGAAMQAGENANGRWWRFQGGLQVCYRQAIISQAASGTIHWPMPAAFSGASDYLASLTMHIGESTDPATASGRVRYSEKYPGECYFVVRAPSDVVADFFAIGAFK